MQLPAVNSAACATCTRLCRTAALVLAEALAATALLFLVRRLANGLTSAPSGLTLLAAALGLAFWSYAIRWLGRLDQPFFGTSSGRAVWLTPTLALLFFGLAVATFPASGLGVAVFWLVIVLSEVAAWVRDRGELAAAWHGHSAPLGAAAPLAIHSAPGLGEAAAESSPPVAENVMLQFTRTRTAGGELISGTARAEFEMGQRVASLHVPFGAPLASVPEVQVEALAHEAVEIVCAQALPHGVRFDLRLAKPASQRTLILFAFEAQAPLGNSAAA